MAFFIILMIMLIGMMILSFFIGPKTNSRAKHIPYESGVLSVDTENKDAQVEDAPPSQHSRFTSHFFLYAIFFVIFDLETIYLFSWVIAFEQVGWAGFIEASIFIVILLVALLYLWRIGALELKHRHQPFREQQRRLRK